MLCPHRRAGELRGQYCNTGNLRNITGHTGRSPRLSPTQEPRKASWRREPLTGVLTTEKEFPGSTMNPVEWNPEALWSPLNLTLCLLARFVPSEPSSSHQACHLSPCLLDIPFQTAPFIGNTFEAHGARALPLFKGTPRKRSLLAVNGLSDPSLVGG